jgi:hypothetical protein
MAGAGKLNPAAGGIWHAVTVNRIIRHDQAPQASS